MAEGWQDRVGIVTGGTGALGTAVVQVLAAAGARIHVPWFAEGEVEAFREAMARGGVEDRVRLHRADVTDVDAVKRLFRDVREDGGKLDFLVNGVGGFGAGAIEESDLSDWDRMMTLNGTSAFLCCRAAVGAMEGTGGRIVNVSAMPAVGRGGPGMSAYAAAKAAVLNLTLSLSRELRDRGITVNAVVPTTIDTPANRRAMPDADRSSWLQPAEIGRVIRFLVSDDAAIVTGAAITLGRG